VKYGIVSPIQDQGTTTGHDEPLYAFSLVGGRTQQWVSLLAQWRDEFAASVRGLPDPAKTPPDRDDYTVR
jgi:hypothetical protein